MRIEINLRCIYGKDGVSFVFDGLIGDSEDFSDSERKVMFYISESLKEGVVTDERLSGILREAKEMYKEDISCGLNIYL